MAVESLSSRSPGSQWNTPGALGQPPAASAPGSSVETPWISLDSAAPRCGGRHTDGRQELGDGRKERERLPVYITTESCLWNSTLCSGNLILHPGSDLPLHSPQNLSHGWCIMGQAQHEQHCGYLLSHHPGRWRDSLFWWVRWNALLLRLCVFIVFSTPLLGHLWSALKKMYLLGTSTTNFMETTWPKSILRNIWVCN